ncbi:hypothetical protein CYLTODRAFT_486874 [Cylindrobasidium torrendii FP15055 ss-10]|uniref:F-box domain-containing protein n=1 Tax=Cylindrobasidium torrendii FP15055 ss-10 TaxID=1314674 RepID=A0A0D7BNK3_9AGAR|nr:hypothetical protein CYLTODRAFT_486874 [Cylindrobasidium torrendii FP15055 ss-10]
MSTSNALFAPRPMESVPAELLIMIFEYLNLDARPTTIDSDIVRLGHVCRRWRAVTHALPAWWACFRVIVTRRSSHRSLAALDFWLQRSKGEMLDVRMERVLAYSETDHPSNPVYAYGTRPWAAEMLKVLLTHSARWRDMTFAIPMDKFDPFFRYNNERRNLPNIRTFIVYGPGLPMPSDSYFHPRHFLLAFDLSRVTSLSLKPGYQQELSLLELVDTLRTCAQLERVSLDVQTNIWEPEVHHIKGAIQMLKLRELSIVLHNFGTTWGYTLRLFQEALGTIKAPLLESVRLEWKSNSWPIVTTVQAIREFLARAPKIRTLHLVDFSVDDGTILTLLGATPALEVLEITASKSDPVWKNPTHDRIFTSTFFEALQHRRKSLWGRSSDFKLVPNLQRCSIKALGHAWDCADMQQFVADRELKEFVYRNHSPGMFICRCVDLNHTDM